MKINKARYTEGTMTTRLLATLVALGLFFSLPAGAIAQDDQAPREMEKKGHQDDDADDEEELTPGSAIERMNEIAKLMQKAEELLHGASLGKAALEQEEILKMLKDLTRQKPEEVQKQVIESLEKLLKKSEEKQKDVIDKLTELIKKAKSQGSG